MSKAPEKIWVSNYAITQWGLDKEITGDIPYIRADLVDELVEALEEIYEWTAYKKTPWAIKAEAALTKVRGKNG